MKLNITSPSVASKLKYFCWILLFFLISLLVGILVFTYGQAG